MSDEESVDLLSLDGFIDLDKLESNKVKIVSPKKNVKVLRKDAIKLIKTYTSSMFSKRSKFLYYKDNKWNFLVNSNKKDNNINDGLLVLNINKTILHSVTFKEETFTNLMFECFPELIKKDHLIIIPDFNHYINTVEKLFKNKKTEAEIEWNYEIEKSMVIYTHSLDSIIDSLLVEKDSTVKKEKIQLKLNCAIKSEVNFLHINSESCPGFTYSETHLPFIEGLNTVAIAYEKTQKDAVCVAVIVLSGSILYYEFFYEDAAVIVRSVQPLYFLLI